MSELVLFSVLFTCSVPLGAVSGDEVGTVRCRLLTEERNTFIQPVMDRRIESMLSQNSLRFESQIP